MPQRLMVSGATRRILATSFTVNKSGQSSPKAILNRNELQTIYLLLELMYISKNFAGQGGKTLLFNNLKSIRIWKMSERFSRRKLLAYAAGIGAGAIAGDRKHACRDFERLGQEDGYNRFINEQAYRCLLACGDEKNPHSLAFDTSSLPYKLYVPGLAVANYPNVTDGWDVRVLPMMASGEIPPLEPERPKWPKEVLQNPVFQGPSDRPLVALTIDDGYFNRNEILDTIIREDVSATFLIIGSVMDSDPAFIKRAQESGRITWGNHTYTHGDLTRKNAGEIESELSRTEATLKKIVGATTIPFMRPPGGARSSMSITAAANLGFRTFLWNVSGDAGTQWTPSDPQALVNYYMGLLDRQANPWGSIILTHFRPATSAALPIMIREIRRRGMEPVSLDRLYEGGRV